MRFGDLTTDKRKLTLFLAGATLLVSSVAFALLSGYHFNKWLVAGVGLGLMAISFAGWNVVTWYRQLAIVLLNTLVLLLVVEVFSSVVVKLLPERPQNYDLDNAYYQSQPWGKDFLVDKASDETTYVPYVIWKATPLTSNSVNTDNEGNRITIGGSCDSESYKVFVFGGSVVWGSGVPDWGTLPTYLQSEMNKASVSRVCVRNFGQIGWVSTQGVIELIRQLQRGERPDLVLFYDGANDVTMAAMEGVAGSHESVSKIRNRLANTNEPAITSRLLSHLSTYALAQRSLLLLRSPESSTPLAPPQNAPGLANNITQTYLNNYRIIEALGNKYQFDFACFWQPHVLNGQKPLTAEEELVLEDLKKHNAGSVELVQSVYSDIRNATRQQDHLFFVADIFQNVSDRVYLRYSHLTHTGNQMVAQRIVMILQTEMPNSFDKLKSPRNPSKELANPAK